MASVEGREAAEGPRAHSGRHQPCDQRRRASRADRASASCACANCVGRENVIASTDCGFAQGPFMRRVHPSIMWAKLEALVAGARIASKKLWSAPRKAAAVAKAPARKTAKKKAAAKVVKLKTAAKRPAAKAPARKAPAPKRDAPRKPHPSVAAPGEPRSYFGRHIAADGLRPRRDVGRCAARSDRRA